MPWCLQLFLILFLLKAVYLAVFVILPWDVPDEIGHLGYIKHVATGEGFPVFRETRMDADMWRSMAGPQGPPADYNWIAQHPPLFYTLMVPGYWVGSLFGDGFVAPLIGVRICNVLLMVLVLFLVFRLARQFSRSEFVSFCVTVMVGSIPLVGQTAAGANNDTLILLVSVLLAYRWLCFSENPSPKNLLWAGIAVGLCGITKYTLLLVMAPVSALVLWRYVQEKGLDLKALLSFLSLGWLPLGTWVVRNMIVIGKPMPTALDHLSFDSPTHYSLFEFFRAYPFFTHSFRSFWGIWGWHGVGQDLQLNTFHLPSAHQALYAALVIGFAVLSVWLLVSKLRSHHNQMGLVACSVALLVVLWLLVQGWFPHEAFYVRCVIYMAVFSGILVVVAGARGVWVTGQPLADWRGRVQLESILVCFFFLLIIVRQMHDYSNEGGALRGTHGRYYFAAMGMLLVAWILPALNYLRNRGYLVFTVAALMVLAEFYLLINEVIPYLNRDA